MTWHLQKDPLKELFFKRKNQTHQWPHAAATTSLSGAQSSWRLQGFHGRMGEGTWMAGVRRTVAASVSHSEVSLPFTIQPVPQAAKPHLCPLRPTGADCWVLPSVSLQRSPQITDSVSQTISGKRAVTLMCPQLQKMVVKGRQQERMQCHHITITVTN